MPLRDRESPSLGNTHGESVDDDNKSNNSTISEFLRRIVPTDKWSLFFPNAGPDNERPAKQQQQQQQPPDDASNDDDDDDFPFDAVPFNGDTDPVIDNHNHNDGIGKSRRFDFSNMDIHVPIEFQSFGSNISPIGNVSSRVLSNSKLHNNAHHLDWFDDSNNHPDDESDDDLDRILGTRQVEQRQQQQQQLPKQQSQQQSQQPQQPPNSNWRTTPTKEDGEILNRTMSTGGESGSSCGLLGEHYDDEDPCKLPLGGCVFERCGTHDDLSVILVEAALEANHTDINKSKSKTEPIQRETILNHIRQQRAASAALAWPKERSKQIRKRSLLRSTKQPTKQVVLYRSRHFWLVVLCVFLTLVLAIMLVTMFPLAGAKPTNTTNAIASNDSNANNNNNQTETTLPLLPAETLPSSPPAVSPLPLPNQEQLPTEPPKPAATTAPSSRPVISTTAPTTTGSSSFLRPSRVDNTTEAPARSPSSSSSLWADNITTAPTKSPSSMAPNPKPFSWSEDNSEFRFGDETTPQESSRLPQVRLDMGPMVGHTTHDSVVLWAYPPETRRGEGCDNSLEILLYDSDGWVTTIEEAKPDPQKNNAVFATVSGLEPLRVYRYEMRLCNQVAGSGSFRTAPPPAGPSGTTFEYILASCMDASEQPVQKAWEAILTTAPSGGTRDGNYPDFALLAGDTIYLKEGIDVDNFQGVNFDRYWYRNYEQRNEPHFAHFVGNIPIYAVWNNHDYGSEVATRYQAGKQESLRAWKSLWPNPGSNESNNSNNNNGIYYSFYWGDVHYIVTDDHWNRDPARENRWGFAQTEWIRSELVSSRGTFKVLVLGSDIMERGWSSDLENIGATVSEHSINGVLFHAGDIHRNEFKRLQTGGFPYPVTQITSSGIAKVWRKPFAKIRVDTTVEDPVMEAFFFGAATNSEENTEWINDPELVCSEIEGTDRTKEHTCSETIRLSDLSVSA